MYSIFLIRENNEKEFYAGISENTPHPIIRSTVKEIADKEGCKVFVRYITPTGRIEEWDNLSIP